MLVFDISINPCSYSSSVEKSRFRYSMQIGRSMEAKQINEGSFLSSLMTPQRRGGCWRATLATAASRMEAISDWEEGRVYRAVLAMQR